MIAVSLRGGLHAARRTGVALATLLAIALVLSGLVAVLSHAIGRTVSVIVREAVGSGDAPEALIADLGGTVRGRLGIINGFVADVPEGGLPRLRDGDGVLSVTLDRRVRLLHLVDGYDSIIDPGSWYNIAETIRAHDLWRVGVTGKGVDVAVIDTGVVPVEGLTIKGKVVNGPDLSWESQDPDLRYLDTYGHGTHMAGLIAGRDGSGEKNHHYFLGMAPDARLLSVKVADATGAADVSQVIAAIDWVVQHRNDNGLNVRVLNLSFGTDGIQDYRMDPLSYAAEVAWRKGIVVVTAAGNSGDPANLRLDNPAYNPRLLAVGADDTRGTYGPQDDVIPSWSSRGDGIRNPDVVAPGKSLASLRDPGSYVDEQHPEGRINSRFFRGSGTSQAAAVVSGAAALLLQHRPGLSPDQVKAVLKATARPIPGYEERDQGAGLIDVRGASQEPAPSAPQSHEYASGTGSLEGARGTGHIVDPNGVPLLGEQDIFGTAWDGMSWSGMSWSGMSWSGGWWRGNEWTGGGWDGMSWSGMSWSGMSWSGMSWSGMSWSGMSWSGMSWSGMSWSGMSWSGTGWTGMSWSGMSWSGMSWSNHWGTRFWGLDFDPSVVQINPAADTVIRTLLGIALSLL